MRCVMGWSAGNEEEVFVEVVKGLGETLVGNYPGAALAAVAAKPALAAAATASSDTPPDASSFNDNAVRCRLQPHASVPGYWRQSICFPACMVVPGLSLAQQYTLFKVVLMH